MKVYFAREENKPSNRVVRRDVLNRLDEAQAASNLASLDAVADVEFAVDVFDVPFDGIDGDDQGFGDLWVAVPGGKQGEDAEFLRRERFKWRSVGGMLWIGNGAQDSFGIGAQRFLCK